MPGHHFNTVVYVFVCVCVRRQSQGKEGLRGNESRGEFLCIFMCMCVHKVCALNICECVTLCVCVCISVGVCMGVCLKMHG